MKNVIAVVFATFCANCLFAQSKRAEMLDTSILDKINRQVAIEALQFKKQLINNKTDQERIVFCVDTFVIRHIEAERIKANNTTLSINKTVIGAINAYDALLQDYYNKLGSLLLTIDKADLLTSNNAWINYQKTEIKLIGDLSKDKYSGGGTIQTNIEAELDEKIVMERLDRIFNYYDTVFKNH
ncbi:lysozyme inhibitor LprI family protein [Mucilaginibacter glaciei]|uniref:DUF1311 domain-containing protein n=1 Tax=Mucilaginibacter glaciei TaxID=2772109 RepID=A0A926NP47_9SPHI|nr:lysozyme inhibitor LprI family protein [Mucilaginibacter glaciei]MBD1392060.1 DUF1311 domain-containing protein [Mucilaginibacter glaciei]